MIYVRTPKDELFNYTECEEMYNLYKDKLKSGEYKDIIKHTFFYAFYIYQTHELIGCIYYWLKGKKLMVNAFAGRKHHLLNLECLKESLNWFDRNIYAEVTEKTSKLCVLRCGFKHVRDNLYVYRRNKK